MTGAQESLRIVHRFRVPPSVVFDALTNPESMRIWWGEGVTFDLDLRVGGRWTIIRREGSTEYLATGEYLEITPPSRLVYTYSMPQFSPNTDTISIDIVADGEGVLLTFEQSGEDIANELRELSPGDVSASEAGWRQGFELMEVAWTRPSTC